MAWIKQYLQQRTSRAKPIQHYEQLWEDLMVYTDYTDTSQLQTQKDLASFFSQVDRDAKNKNRKPIFSASRLFRERMAEALNKLNTKGITATKRKPQDIVPGGSLYTKKFVEATGTTISKALKEGRIPASLAERYVYYEQGTPKIKTPYKNRKGTTVTAWRNGYTGRFTKPPK